MSTPRLTRKFLSFDIGNKSFAESIVSIDCEQIDVLKSMYAQIPVGHKYSITKYDHQSKECDSVFDTLYKSIKIEHLAVHNFSPIVETNAPEKSKYIDFSRDALLMHLNEYKDLFCKCDEIIIEKQMSAFKTQHINFDAIKISETVHTWATMQRLNGTTKALVRYIPSKYKTDYNAAPHNMTYAQRKKWSVSLLHGIAKLQNDTDLLTIFDIKAKIKGKRKLKEEFVHDLIKPLQADCMKQLANRVIYDKQKLDDTADAVCQVPAYIFAYYIK